MRGSADEKDLLESLDLLWDMASPQVWAGSDGTLRTSFSNDAPDLSGMNLAGDRHTGDGSPDDADQVDEENSDADDVRDRSGDDAMDDAGAPPPDQPPATVAGPADTSA